MSVRVSVRLMALVLKTVQDMLESSRWFLLCLILAISAGSSPGETPAGASAASTASQPADVAHATDPETLTPQILPVPADDDEITTRLALVTAELEKLGPTSQPSTAPATNTADELAGVRWRLADALQQYRLELENWQKVRADIQQLKSPEATDKLIADRQRWEQLQQNCLVRRENEMQYAWNAKGTLEEITKEYTTQAAELQRYEALQSAREQQLTAMGPKKTATDEAVKNTLADLRKNVSEVLPAALAHAAKPEERLPLLMQKRVLEWQHNLQLLRSATFADLNTQLDIARRQDEDRIKALGSYVAALQAYRNDLEKIVTQDAAELAARQLDRADLPDYLRIYWQIRLTLANGAVDFQAFQKFIDDIRLRFPDSEMDRLEQRIKRAQWYLGEFMESLDRRGGTMILDAYRKAGDLSRTYKALLDQYSTTFDQITDKLRNAQDCQDDLRLRLSQDWQTLETKVKNLQGDELAQATKQQDQLTSDVNALIRDRIDKVMAGLTALRDRFDKMVPLLADQAKRLELARSRLYWRRLMVPDRSLFDLEWGTVRQEWNQLTAGQGASAQLLRDGFDRTRADLREIPIKGWLTAALLLVLGAYIGRRSGGRLQAWVCGRDAAIAEATQKGQSQPAAGLPVVSTAYRLEIQLARALARSAVLLVPLLLLFAYLLSLQVGGKAFPLVAVLLALFLVVLIGHVTVNAMFDPQRPNLRIIQCGDTIARYHRRWLRLLGAVGLIFLPLPLFARIIGFLPATNRLAWDLAMSAFFLLLFAYLVRRRMFVHLSVGQTEKPGLWTRLWPRAFPLCPITVAALLGLQWAGYVALVDFLIQALVQTILVLVAARVLRGLLAAWSGIIHEFITARHGDDDATINILTGSSLGRITAQLTRLAVFFAAALIILHAWGVSFVEIQEWSNYTLLNTNKGPITPRRIAAAFLVVAAGVMISRTLRAFLHTEVFPQTRHVDRGTQAAITMLLHYSIIALTAYVGLRLLMLDLGALTILLGTVGLGLGLGLQPLFINFISGLMILFERQVKVGDIIEVDGTPGEVLAVSMRSTRIRTPDNVEYVIPNGDFITGRVINWTLSDQHLRARLQIGVAYGSDIQLIRKLLLDIAHRHPDVLVDPPPEVWFLDFADNALLFVLVCWFANAPARWRFLSQVRFEITEVFRLHNIDIPFPQRTLSFLGDKPLAVELRRPAKPASESPTPPEK